MCNEYEFQTQWEEYVELMAALELGIPATQGPADLPRLASIRIGDTAPVMRPAGNGVELAPMRFGFPAPRPKAGPVFNFRSEGRSFRDSNRGLIPATGFFEFTGAKYPKTKHRFWMEGVSLFAIAGIWRDGDKGPAFTMLTTEPGPDVAPIHDRQIVALPPQDWAAWLYLTKLESELLRPTPAGSLQHAVVRA
jgi:putative SOS response-associated peptidase YedK